MRNEFTNIYYTHKSGVFQKRRKDAALRTILIASVVWLQYHKILCYGLRARDYHSENVGVKLSFIFHELLLHRVPYYGP